MKCTHEGKYRTLGCDYCEITKPKTRMQLEQELAQSVSDEERRRQIRYQLANRHVPADKQAFETGPYAYKQQPMSGGLIALIIVLVVLALTAFGWILNALFGKLIGTAIVGALVAIYAYFENNG